MRLKSGNNEYLLSYSTNVHAGESLDDVLRILEADVVRVRDQICADRDFGVELRLGHAAITGLQSEDALNRLGTVLDDNRLFLFSINGFPLRDFHAEQVKQEAYRPDWTEEERQQDTLRLCRILARLLPAGMTGTISTSPGSYKPWGNHPALRAEIARGFAPVIHALHEIYRDQEQLILLAVEPEPFCTCETVVEFVDFVESEIMTHAVQSMVDDFGLDAAEAANAVRRHFGINLDACHLAVEFEDPARAVKELLMARIPIAKLHVSAAARVCEPATNPEGMRLLRGLNEPRYLHQTFARDRRGNVVFRAEDLAPFLELSDRKLGGISEARTHFHMPLTASANAPLGSTSDVTSAILNLLPDIGGPGHLVAETYTWSLLTETDRVHLNIARELEWILSVLAKADKT